MTESTEDRGSSVRISALRAINVGGKGYVKIETNMDVVGWGEINNMDTKVACALAESLGEIVIGENPTRIEHLWQRMFRAHRNLRGGGFMLHVISAIDMALWDIKGKRLEVPVYDLMGGKTRDRVRCYMHVNPPDHNDTAEGLAKDAAKVVREGFSAVRFSAFPKMFHLLYNFFLFLQNLFINILFFYSLSFSKR